MVKKGEIDRLDKLLHLGVIQSQFPGMRHTRLDYTMTMLHLTQQLREAGWEGLSSKPKVGSIRLSGRDSLQILALVSNIGHLPGTFAVEKGIMHFIVNKNLTNDFKEHAKLNRDIHIDYSTLNKVLALIKLRKWIKDEKHKKRKELLQAAIELLSELVTSKPSTEHRRKVFEYFNLVRRVSYQLIDCIYVNLPIKIEYGDFINQLHVLSQRERLENVLALIDHYTRIVYAQIYHAESARKQLALCAKSTYESLSTQVNADPGSVLQKEVCKWLKKSEWDGLGIGHQGEQNLDNILSVTLPHAPFVNFLTESFVDKNVDELELDLSTFLGSPEITVLYIPGLRDLFTGETSPGELRFDVFITHILSIKDRLKILGKTLVWCYRNFGSAWGIGIFNKAVFQSLLQTALGNVNSEVLLNIAPDDFFRDDSIFVPEDKLKMFHAAISQKKEASKLFRNKEDTKWDQAKKERFFECKALKELIKKEWEPPRPGLAQYYVVIPAQIRFKDTSKNQDICEFDAALMRLSIRGKNVSQITLFLLEAKSGKTEGSSKAKRELKSRIAKLNNKFTNNVRYRVLGGRTKGAYAKVDLF